MIRVPLLVLALCLLACDTDRVYVLESTHDRCWVGDSVYYVTEELPLNVYVSMDRHSDVLVEASWVGPHGSVYAIPVDSHGVNLIMPFTCGESIRLELMAFTYSEIVLEGSIDGFDVDYRWNVALDDGHGPAHRTITYPSISLDLYPGETAVVHVTPVEY